ncbi:MAG: CheR family methyltransferase, partial [Gammaproteobacteria bacterium]
MNKNEIPSPADRLDALALESGVGERAAGDRAAGDRAAAGREQLVNKRVKLESSTECASDVGAPSAIPLATRLSVLDKGVARKQPSHIVGIGVSMAGLDLLQKLFGSLSSDMGAAYVVVQHGTPDCQRIQVEVLSTYTAMPVQAVEMGIEISANSVYLIRPSQNVRLVAGRWYLNDIASGCSLYPIDQFFRTLADEKTHQAIGVILSGVGDDGVRGAHALKEADGMVIVQASRGDARGLVLDRAMASGLVDLCLPVEDIGSALEKFIKHPLIRQGDGGLRIAIDDQRDSMVQIFDLLRKKKKIDFSYYKHTTVARRIERRMGIKQLHSLNDYVHCLRESSDELSILMNELLMGSTRFFRDDEAFRCVQKRAIRALIKAASVETGVRIWVAGCSTGEEAYSFAIIADEECRRLGKRVPITIYATDVDADALTVAAAATFTAHIRQDVSAERLASYFTWKDKRYVLSAAIRRMVIFVMHNMITDPSFLSIDLISCRNTLIYFQHSMQKRVLASMHAALKWEGLLFLGVSESVGDFHSYFDVLDARSRLYRKSSR